MELSGHYNMHTGEFDGLTVVSNLFLFPYVKAFKDGFRSPHSTVALMPAAGKDKGENKKAVRAYHLAGIKEKIGVIIPKGAKAARVAATDMKGEHVHAIKFKMEGGGVTFTASPYQMYVVTVK